MTKKFKIGPQYEWDSFGEDEGQYLDGVTSYGDTSESIPLSIGDYVEITYRGLTLVNEQYSYFIDNNIGDTRASIYISDTIGTLSTGKFTYEIDGIPATALPDDSDVHVLKATATISDSVFRRIGVRYNSENYIKCTIEGVNVNGVNVNGTWTNTVTVGGQSGTKLDYEYYATLALFASAKHGTVDTGSGDYEATYLGVAPVEVITSSIAFDIDLGANTTVLDGEGKTDLIDSTTGFTMDLEKGNFEITGFKITSTINKSGAWYSTIQVNYTYAVASNVHDITFDFDGYKSNCVLYHSAEEHFFYKNIIENSSATAENGGLNFDWDEFDGTAFVFSNTFINTPVGISHRRRSSTGTVTEYNNYFDCMDTYIENADVAKQIVKLGGSVESSSVPVVTAFVDTIDYVPTILLQVGISLQVAEDAQAPPYYAGANSLGAASVGVNRSRKRKIKMKIAGY